MNLLTLTPPQKQMTHASDSLVDQVIPVGFTVNLLYMSPLLRQGPSIDSAPQVRQHSVLVDMPSAVLRELPATVFINPAAGGGCAGRYLPAIREVFASYKISAEFLLTDSAHNLESRARAAIDDGRRLFFAIGGDGTFHVLVNAASDSDVLLGLLPAGGGNDFASALGLPRDPLAAARSVLCGQPRLVDMLRVRTGDGSERLYSGGGGLGLDVGALRYAVGAYRRLPGRWRYIAGMLRAYAGFSPVGVRAEFPSGECPPIQASVLLAAVFNTPSFGSGIRLAPEAKIDDGLLDVVLVEDVSTPEMLAALPRLFYSGDLGISRVRRTRARCVELSADRPCLFQGDGEILGCAPVHIAVVPRAVRVLAPLLTEALSSG
jgi:diacylglycerol kinase (ATP)